MSDETNEPEITDADVAAPPTPPPAAPTAPAPNPGQSMGYTSRGASVPSGTDEPTATPSQPAPILQPTAPAPPPARVNRVAVAQQARAAREQDLKDRWNADYAASKSVPANGYQITPEEQADMQAAGIPINPRTIAAHAARLSAQAQTDAIRQAEEQDRQENATATSAREAQMSAAERQMRDTGQRYFIDSNRQVQPINDPTTGRPLYNPTGWEEGVHPDTGNPVLTMRDRYGQTQYKTPQIVHNPDLTDNQLYYKFPNGKMKPAGSMDDLVKSPDFAIKRAAIQAVGQRRAAQWKEAVQPMQDIAAQAKVNHDMAADQVLDLQGKSQKIQDEINQLNANPQLNETAGGILGSGLGAKPTDAAIALQSQLAAKQDQLKQYNDQTTKLQESLKPTGDLGRAARQAQLNLGIFKSSAQHDNYANLADERRAILQSQGKPEAGDPTLQAILKAQDTFKAAISRYSDVAKTEGIPTAPAPVSAINTPASTAPVARGAHPLNPSAPKPLTDDQRIASTGARLPVGAPIPGKPNAFESVHDQPSAPSVTPSKVTLSQQDIPLTNDQIAQKFQDAQDKMAPALDLMQKASSGIDALRQQGMDKATAAQKAAQDPSQANEPFALAAKGITHVGGVSVDQLAKRYGDGQGPVAPLSLLKMKQRISDIDSTLNSNNALDPKLQQSMKEEKDWLTSQATQRFARLSTDDQKRVTEATRPPTNWEIAKANLGAYAKESGKSTTDIAEGLGKLVTRGANLYTNPAALTQIISGMDDPLTQKIDDYAKWEKQAIEESHAPTTSAEEKAQQHWTAQLSGTVGGFVPYVIGGTAAKAAGAGAAVQGAVSGVSGALGMGQSLRDEAQVGLQKQLDAGKITKEQYNSGVQQAEGLGTVIGASMMLPFGNFARAVGKTVPGQRLVGTLLSKIGQGGMEAATKWVQSPEGQNIFRRAATGATEGAITGFGQAVANNLAAQGKAGNVAFDPERGTLDGASASAASLGLLGAMHGAMHAGTLKGSIQEVADAMPKLFWKINETTPDEYRKAAENVRKFGGTPEEQELVKKVAAASIDTTAREILRKQDPKAADRILQGVATDADNKLYEKIKNVAGKGISVGDIQAGRADATIKEVGDPRLTHKILPENLRPKAPEGGVELTRISGDESAAPKASTTKPGTAAERQPAQKGPPAQLTEHEAAAHNAADDAAEASEEAGKVAQTHADNAAEASHAAGEAVEGAPDKAFAAAKVGDEIDHPMVGRTVMVDKRLTTTSPAAPTQVKIAKITRRENTRGGSQMVEVHFSNGDSIARNAGLQSDGEVVPLSKAIDGALSAAGAKLEPESSSKTNAPEASKPEVGPEEKKASPGKLAQVDAALKDKDTTYQYSVWDRGMVGAKKSRVAQVDMLSPNAEKDGNHGSASINLLREKGVDLPEPPESLPPGRYTAEQVKEAIAKEKSAPAKSETAAPELGDQRVKLKVKRGNGSEVEMEMSANDAAKRVNDHLANLKRVKDCLGGVT